MEDADHGTAIPVAIGRQIVYCLPKSNTPESQEVNVCHREILTFS